MEQDLVYTDAASLIRLFGAMNVLRILRGQERYSERDFMDLTGLPHGFVIGAAAVENATVPLKPDKVSALKAACAPLEEGFASVSVDSHIKTMLPRVYAYVNSGFTASIGAPDTPKTTPAGVGRSAVATNVFDFRTGKRL